MSNSSDLSVFLSYLHFAGFRHGDLYAYWGKRAHFGEMSILDDIRELQHKSESFLARISDELGFKSDRTARIGDKMARFEYELFSERFLSFGAQCLFFYSDTFPKWLLQLKDPPFLLYYLWSWERFDSAPLKISVVWSRESTPYGESIVKSFLPELVRHEISIVSGGALWIDGVAHKTTLQLHWCTIAVLGSWINRPYPRKNECLFSEIASNGGVVVSHFPFDTEAAPYTFPIRNEIIAGMSDGVFVVEAKERSGSLITAHLALELGKEIFAPPSDIGRWNSLGTNRLIQKSSAKLVIGPGDILEEFGMQKLPLPHAWTRDSSECGTRFSQKGDVGWQILSALEWWAFSSDRLIELLWLDFSELQIELWKMEIQGTIVRNSTWAYSLNHG